MNIIKKREYYYLRYSFRNEGKVTTKDVYLGKEVPGNIKEIKQKIMRERQKQMYQKFEKIRTNFQKEWKKSPESAKQREKEEIAIAFTYNTEAIEGSTITLEETREIVVDKIAPNKSLRDIKETEVHFKVFLNMLSKKESISKTILLQWHKDLFGETKPDIAGRYRDFHVRIGGYIAPDWQDVEKLMKEFLEFFRQSKLNPVELAARTHYKFEKIHPFGDGNGRVGRFLMNHLLWRNGYPMLIIEYKKRQSYYKALRRTEDGFVQYFIRRYLSVHKKRYL